MHDIVAWLQIPVAQEVEDEHSNTLNLVFRIIMPNVITFLATLFQRFYPSRKVSHLQNTQVSLCVCEREGKREKGYEWGER